MLGGNGERDPSYPLRVPAWRDVPHLVHGFLGRAHGLPPGPFTEADVRANLQAAGETPKRILIALQVHGTRVLGPEEFDPGPTFPTADAIVTASADVILTIRTADCVPILLLAPRARAIAAIHAGWRGTTAGIIAKTIQALDGRYAARPHEIQAAIGPAIGPCCYEFGAEHLQEFRTAFGAKVETTWYPFSPHAPSEASRVHLDLRAVVRLALTTAGVPLDAITVLGPCTADSPTDLHSYRRDGAKAGRQLSYIGWRQ